jgi:hypothetical protein
VRKTPRTGLASALLATSVGSWLVAGCATARPGAATSPIKSSVSTAPQPATTSAPGDHAEWQFHNRPWSYPWSSESNATIASGSLDIVPHVDDPTSCPLLFQPNEVVDLSGGGFEPGTAVTVILALGRTASDTRIVKADGTGAISLTAILPPDLTGIPADGGAIGYIEADGDGQASTEQMDDAMFRLGKADATCGATPSITVTLIAPRDVPGVSGAGAMFAVTGPGLPPLSPSPTPGTFAEIDTDENGAASCPSREPAGVVCKDGDLRPLRTDATYTVTEVSPPPHLKASPPQTITVDEGMDGPDGVEFENTYDGPALAGSVRVNLLSTQGSPLPGGAVFAVTGPGLPPLTSPPSPGTFAEIDVGAGGWTNCSASEPTGIACLHGVIQNLQPSSRYSMSEIKAPVGYKTTMPSQQFETSNDGTLVIVQFTCYEIPPTTSGA